MTTFYTQEQARLYAVAGARAIAVLNIVCDLCEESCVDGSCVACDGYKLRCALIDAGLVEPDEREGAERTEETQP